MITSSTTNMAMRATRARGIVACCLKRNNSACAYASGSSTMMNDEFEARGRFLDYFQSDGPLREQIAYSLSLAGSGSLYGDFESGDTFPLLDERMKRQLRNSYNALASPSDYDVQKLRSRLPSQLDLSHLLETSSSVLGQSIERKLPPLDEQDEDESSAGVLHAASSSSSRPLPISISDILSSKLDEDARAIVITDTKNPYRIVTVNTAWENLCGYSREECKGLSVGGVLQGPETDMGHVSAMLGKLIQGEEAGAILTNYAKNGRKFRNDLRVGPIFDEMGKTVNFVGVLRELEDVGEGNLGQFAGGDGQRMQLPFMS
mmetsp:Transcript_5358/g.11767  ORF Transcript_5358/g.11767 Transcript_5358/m.11767 type:complete len:318 (-) Transcript_5358:125-1078(-)